MNRSAPYHLAGVKRSKSRGSVWIIGLLAGVLGVAQADTASWKTGSGAWNSAGNWDTAVVPGATLTGDVAKFGTAASSTGIVTLDNGAGTAYSPVLSNLVINPTGGANAGFTINAGAGGHLTMAPNATITWDTGPGTGRTNAINAGVVMQGHLGVNVLANAGVPLAINGVISDGGHGFGLTVTGPGALTLTGANTFTGSTTVSSGTLNLNTSGANALSGNLTINGGAVVLKGDNQIADGRTVAISSGSLNIGSHSDTVAGVQITGGSIGGTTGVLTSATSFDVQAGMVSAILGGNVGLNKTSGGTATLSGANTFTGNTTVAAGTLQLNATGAPALAGNLVINGGTVVLQQNDQILSSKTLLMSIGATLSLVGHSQTLAGVQMNGGQINGASGVLTSTTAFDMRSGTVAVTLDGEVGLNKTSVGTVTLSGVNTYTGTTTVTAGTLNLNTAGAAAVAGDVLINGGTLVLQQNNQINIAKSLTISSGALNMGSNSVTLAGVQMSGGSITGTTGLLTSTTAYDLQGGSVSAILGGNVGLNKTSTNTVTLSGANTFTGTTTVTAGNLNLNTTGAPALGGNVMINGGTLVLLQSNQMLSNRTITVAAGTLSLGTSTQTVGSVQLAGGAILTGTGVLTSTSSFDLQAGSVGGILGGNVGLNKTTPGTVTLTGTNTYTGTTTVSDGVLNLNTPSGSAIPGDLVVNGGSVVLQRGNQVAASKTVSVAGGSLALGANNLSVAGVQLTGGSITGTGLLTNASNFDLQGGAVGAVLAGSVAAAVTTGSVTLTNQNLYTGLTTVSAGGSLNLNSSSGPALPGGLTVNPSGTATLLLNNQLPITGQVKILGGTLDMATHSNTVASVQLTSGGQILGTGALTSRSGFDLQSGTVNAILAGTVGVNVTSGTVTLAGANTYTGPTKILSGTLQLQGSTAAASDLAVTTLGTLSGSGTVKGNTTLTGSGVVDLGGKGTIAGTLDVTGGNWNGQGTVNGLVTSSSGTFSLGTGAVLTAPAGLNITGGNLVGSGTVVGNVTLGGAGGIAFGGSTPGTIVGTLTVLGGTFNGAGSVSALTLNDGISFDLGAGARLTLSSGQLNVQGDAALNGGTLLAPGGFKINTQGTLQLGSDLSSAGGLIKTGTGTLKLGGEAVLGGNTEVHAGTLTLDGTLTTPLLSVSQGATFNGSGLLVGSLSNLGGTFNPGHSPGTLFVTGDFSQGKASTLVLEVLNPHVHDRVIVTGTAHLAGTLAVRDYGGHHFAFGDAVTGFVEAAHIAGSFDKVTMPGADLRGRVVNTGASLTLVAAPATYTLVARTPNQRSLAEALDHLIGHEKGDVGTVTLALDVLQAAQYAGAFNAILPAAYSVLPHIGIEEAGSQNAMLQQRFAEIRAAGHAKISERATPSGSQAPSSGSFSGGPITDKSPAMFASDDESWRPWMQLSGQFAQMETLQTLANNHFDAAGALVGMDRRLGNESAFGINVGYGYTRVGYDGGDGTTINTGRVTLYAEAGLGDGWFIDSSVGGGYANYDVKRPVVFSFINRVAHGQTDGSELSAAAQFGKDFHWGNWTMTPQVGLLYDRTHLNGQTESGAGALNLAVDGYGVQSLRGTLGAQVAYRARLSDKVTLAPYLAASWQHEFDSQGENVRAALPAGGDAPFIYQGGSLGSDRLLACAGVALSLGPDLSFNLGYQAEFGSGDYESHLIMLMVSYRF